MQGIYGIAKEILAFKDRLCSLELVISLHICFLFVFLFLFVCISDSPYHADERTADRNPANIMEIKDLERLMQKHGSQS